MEKYRITDSVMPHLERLKLGAKLIQAGHHRNMNFHNHSFSELAIILHAVNTRHWAEGKSCQIKRGDVILIHPGKKHAYENTSDLSLFNLLFEPEFLPIPFLDGPGMRLFNQIISLRSIESPELPLITLDENQLMETEHLASELQKELADDLPGKNLRSFALFLNLLTLICRAGGGSPGKKITGSINDAVNYINCNFSKKIDLDQLAKKSNMSRRGFFRKFKETTGLAPRQYMMQKKLATAEELLRTTDFSLSDIAEQCGFYDSNHLNKLFSQCYNMPPGKFRTCCSLQKKI